MGTDTPQSSAQVVERESSDKEELHDAFRGNKADLHEPVHQSLAEASVE